MRRPRRGRHQRPAVLRGLTSTATIGAATIGAMLCATACVGAAARPLPHAAHALPNVITPTVSNASVMLPVPRSDAPAALRSMAPVRPLPAGATAASAAPAPAHPPVSCHDAAQAAEQAAGLPAGMLDAIGRVESGRYDPATGQTWAWPWAVNAAGEGHSFASFEEAAVYVRGRQAVGVASIDVGCFQINLMHHPDAFASLEEAFDPIANANYAARFLTDLRGKTGDWKTAIAWYHSATPGLGEPYRDMVLARWPGNESTAQADAKWHANPTPPSDRAPAPMLALAAMPAYGMRVWTPAPSTAPAAASPATYGGAVLIQVSPRGYSAAAARLPRIMTAAR